MKYSLTVLTLVSAMALTAGTSSAADLVDLGDVPSSAGLDFATGISGNGQIVVGTSEVIAGDEGFRWTLPTGMVGLGDLPGGTFESSATKISRDGTTIVGGSIGANNLEAFIWTAGGGMIGLGDLAGGVTYSTATDVNADGTVVVGTGSSASGIEAFRWTSGGGMVGLGDLTGGSFFSRAYAVSDDGNVVAGFSGGANGTEAFRWTSGSGMVGLGDLAGGTFFSAAYGISGDGNVVIGYSETAAGNEAFRWTSGTGMVGLGHLAGGGYDSVAFGSNYDGSIIIGQSDNLNGDYEAFRWTQAGGMESIQTILANAGIDLTGWEIVSANDMDDTGNIIVGEAYLFGNQVAFLADLTTMAVTTPVDLGTGLVSAVVPVQQTQSALTAGIGQSLFAATQSIAAFRPAIDISNPADIAPAAGGVDRVWSGYITGSFGAGQDNDFDNNAVNGTMGLLVELDRNLVIGAGIIGSHGRADRQYSGDSSLDSKGGSVIAAYEADNGVRLYGTAFVADLQIDSKRGYLNGAGLDASYADIDGMGFGAALRGGYEFAVSDKTNLMPYVEIQASRTKLDGYTETGGGFPATFSDTTSDLVTSYVGTEISYDVTSTLSIGGRAAWAHRLKEDDDGITASVTGFTGTFSAEKGDQNWGEAAVSANWQITEDTRLGTELSGRSGKTQEPAATLTLGLQHRF